MTRQARMVGGGFVRDGEPLAEPAPLISEADVTELEQAAKNVLMGRSDGIDRTYMPDVIKLIDFYRAHRPTTQGEQANGIRS